MPHTPGIWRHVSHPIAFTLVVDNFGIKYVGNKHAKHLANALNYKYKISENWTGRLYCGIDLEWDYVSCTLGIRMLGYIKTKTQQYKHDRHTCPHQPPHPVAPRRYGKSAQYPIPHDENQTAGPDNILHIQQVVGNILY